MVSPKLHALGKLESVNTTLHTKLQSSIEGAVIGEQEVSDGISHDLSCTYWGAYANVQCTRNVAATVTHCILCDLSVKEVN